MKRRNAALALLSIVIAVAANADAPLRVGGDVKAPILVERVDPAYSAEARAHRISGIVIVEALIDRSGNVAEVNVLKPLPFGLDRAAVDAVKQWKFKPATQNGKPVAVLFNLTVNFILKPSTKVDGSIPALSMPDADGMHRVGGDVKAPVVIRRVEPHYTPEARANRVAGVVILEAVIDREGNVKDVRVLKPLPFGLDTAAADALRQWKFKPGTLDGKPVDVIFNLTMSFRPD